jgi:hypothetical protein
MTERFACRVTVTIYWKVVQRKAGLAQTFDHILQPSALLDIELSNDGLSFFQFFDRVHGHAAQPHPLFISYYLFLAHSTLKTPEQSLAVHG